MTEALTMFVMMGASWALGVLTGAEYGRRQMLRFMRRINGDRETSVQAEGADLIRQVERMRHR